MSAGFVPTDRDPTATGGPTSDADDVRGLVARAEEGLEDVEEAGLDEHVERYRSIHADLQQALSDAPRS